jgi:hypothetical protein
LDAPGTVTRDSYDAASWAPTPLPSAWLPSAWLPSAWLSVGRLDFAELSDAGTDARPAVDFFGSFLSSAVPMGAAFLLVVT